VRLELLADLLLQRDARVEHHAQQADDLQVRFRFGVHLLDRVDQVAQALEREVLALHRTITPWALHRPFSVSRLSDGGQSISTKS
jgi:hypothetical protein